MSLTLAAPSSSGLALKCLSPVVSASHLSCKPFFEKNLGEISPEDFSGKFKKVEFFNSDSQSWEEISPLILRELVLSGLNEARFDSLCRATSNFKWLYRSVNDLAQDIFANVARIYEDQAEGIWSVVRFMADQRLAKVYNSQKDFKFQRSSKGPDSSLALILEGEGLRETDLLKKTIHTVASLGTLSEKYGEVQVRQVDSFEKMCETIQKAAQKNLQFLMVKIHGASMSFGINQDSQSAALNGGIWSKLSTCLRRLSPKAVIVLNSCLSGLGQETGWNMANAFAAAVPKGVQVFAPNGFLSFTTVSRENESAELILKFWEDRGYINNTPLTPYHIVAGDKVKHCFDDRISFLPFCNSRRLLKATQGEDNFSYGRKFYSKYYGKWQKIGEKSWNFLMSKGFSNHQLEIISDSTWHIGDFCEKAAQNYSHLGAKRIMSLMRKADL